MLEDSQSLSSMIRYSSLITHPLQNEHFHLKANVLLNVNKWWEKLQKHNLTLYVFIDEAVMNLIFALVMEALSLFLPYCIMLAVSILQFYFWIFRVLSLANLFFDLFLPHLLSIWIKRTSIILLLDCYFL